MRAWSLLHTNEVSQQIKAMYAGYTMAVASLPPSEYHTRTPLVVHPNQKQTGKKVLENMFQPCQLTHYKAIIVGTHNLLNE